MSQLKEQNGRYYQQCQVVMLATNNKSNLSLNTLNENELFFNPTLKDNIEEYPNQNLYFYSNSSVEHIKDNDWCYNIKSGKIDNVKTGTSLYNLYGFGWRKIIATTDESLRMYIRPSYSFIKKYIDEYNDDRQITKVLVEYVKHPIENYWYLHIDSDYEITITKLKDSYSREEVIKLLNSAIIAAGSHSKKIQAYYMTDIGEPPLTPESFTNQWIEDNL